MKSASRNKRGTKNHGPSSKQFVQENILLNEEFHSLLLEPETLAMLDHICSRELIKHSILIGLINARKKPEVSLENACRIFVLTYMIKSDINKEHREDILKRFIRLTEKPESKTKIHDNSEVNYG